jgi:molybdopterin converting factor small subunit
MEYKLVPVNMPLVKKDKQFLHLQDLIDGKRRMLLEKQKKLRFITKQNHFLDAVKSDYAKYYSYISQQKNDQIDALNLLNNYIKDLTVSGQLSKHNIDDAKFEQDRIMKEVNQIKRGLDNIMDDTDEISLNLRKKNII